MDKFGFRFSALVLAIQVDGGPAQRQFGGRGQGVEPLQPVILGLLIVGRRLQPFVPYDIVAIGKLQQREEQVGVLIEGIPFTHQPL